MLLKACIFFYYSGAYNATLGGGELECEFAPYLLCLMLQ